MSKLRPKLLFGTCFLCWVAALLGTLHVAWTLQERCEGDGHVANLCDKSPNEWGWFAAIAVLLIGAWLLARLGGRLGFDL